MDSIIWQKDARYEYYKHGPLARVVIGEQLLQGLDYSYTLQGWLKGINSTAINSDHDMGQDGKPGTSNQYVARDVWGLNLNYFGGDYSSINKGYDPFPDHWAFLPDSSKRPLYNGNISGIAMSLLPLSNSFYFGGATMLYRYRYDQLNRLTGMDALNGFDHTNNNWTGLTAVQQYKERVRYDANGNILGYLRNGHNPGSDIEKDSLSYKYYSGTNRLKYLKEIAPSSNYAGTSILDLENQTNTSNYKYDSIGNLVSDAYEGITDIRWNVYGKIREITRTPSASLIASKISYIYDAQGNRIGEIIDRSVSPDREYTWYVRDAQGNVLAIYNAFGSTNLASLAPNQRVRPIYGSSRIGTHQESVNVDGGPQAMDQLDNFVFTRGKRVYTLSNHLENVVTTLTDRKFGVPVGAAGTPIAYYEADIFTANDYFPFGMRMLGRTYIPLGVPYRYGFNGKENDDDVKGIANQQDYGMRIYDPRVGRFLSVDPLQEKYPELTPYQFASNSPIQGIDLDGLEIYHYTLTYNKDKKPVLTYLGEQTRNYALWEIFDSRNDNWKSFNGDKIETKSIYIHIGNVTSDAPEYTFKYFKELHDWAASGFPEKTKNDNTAAQESRDAVTTMTYMELSQKIDQADGDNDGYVNPNNYNKGNSSPTSNTNKQATAATGSKQPAKSNTATDAKPSTLRPGPYAKESIPATTTAPKFTPLERAAINKIGKISGCHTCGVKVPGTKSGNWVPDHQPSSAINPAGTPQVLLPHCISCSRKQGGEVSVEKKKASTKKTE